MTDQENGLPENPQWLELKLPQLLLTDTVRRIHAKIDTQWDYLQRTACQTAAGRAMWKHVIHDPLADVLAGETYLRSVHEKIKQDRLNNAREISGIILAIRTLWFDSQIEAALNSFNSREAQVVLLGAGCLKESDVFEVDFPEVLQVKTTLIQTATESGDEQQHLRMRAKSLLDTHAMQVLKLIADKCTLVHTVLLADFMNKPTSTLSSSIFHFYSDWPDHLLPSLGFSHVKLSQIGDPDAHFGLMHDPLNLFNKLRSLPRSVQTNPDDGTPCRRLYLVQASGSPNQTIQNVLIAGENQNGQTLRQSLMPCSNLLREDMVSISASANFCLLEESSIPVSPANSLREAKELDTSISL